jgi:hypothetical protein
VIRLFSHGADDLVAFGEAGPRTLRELMRDAEAIAKLLPSSPAKDGLRHEVLVACGDRYVFAACIVAAWSRGFAVALPPNVQKDTIERLSKEPHVRALLHDTGKSIGVDVRHVLNASSNDARAIESITFAPDHHIATIFTSGSTSEPRASLKTAAHLLGEAAVHARTTFRNVHRVVATVPPIHIYGLLFGVLIPFARGAAFSRETPLHAPTVAATLRTNNADALVTVPAHLRAFESLDGHEIEPKVAIFSSGAVLSKETREMLSHRFDVSVTDVLGSSETGGIATRVSNDDVWRTLDGVRVTANDDGEMRLDSPFASVDRSADRIAMIDATTFRHLGRADSVVKVASKRVDLEEMRNRLLELEGVSDAAIFAETTGGARGDTILAAVATSSSRWTMRALFEPQRPRTFDVRPRSAPGTFDVHVPRDLDYFRGHFEGEPILAGVVQVNILVLKQIKSMWPELTHLSRITRLRFRRPIRPDDDLVLSLVRSDHDRVRFALIRGTGKSEITCSEGSLHFDRALA